MKFDFGIALECWLASRRAPERSRQCGKRVARPSALDPGVKQNWQPSQLGKPEFGADVDGAKRQHTGSQSSYPEPRHDSRSDRGNSPTHKNLCPRHARGIEKLHGARANAAGFGHRRKREWLVRAMLPTGRRKPAKLLLGNDFSVVPPDMLTGEHRVELPPIEASKQVLGRAYPDCNQQLRILRVHAGDQCGEFRSRDMVADSDGKALPGSGK